MEIGGGYEFVRSHEHFLPGVRIMRSVWRIPEPMQGVYWEEAEDERVRVVISDWVALSVVLLVFQLVFMILTWMLWDSETLWSDGRRVEEIGLIRRWVRALW